jgi:hypothetical protein
MWDSFSRRIEATWTHDTDEPIDNIWLATLNLVLASAAQIQLSRNPDQALADLFFRRSQAHLPLNLVLNDPDLDIVRCMLPLAIRAPVGRIFAPTRQLLLYTWRVGSISTALTLFSIPSNARRVLGYGQVASN